MLHWRTATRPSWWRHWATCAKGMSQVARDAGLGRASLYKALLTTGNPEFATTLKVVRALGLRFHVEAECTWGTKVPAVSRGKEETN